MNILGIYYLYNQNLETENFFRNNKNCVEGIGDVENEKLNTWRKNNRLLGYMDGNTAILGNTTILGYTDPEDEKLLVRIQILLWFKKFIYNRMRDT